eukprot:scpid39194/ scgid2188/ 
MQCILTIGISASLFQGILAVDRLGAELFSLACWLTGGPEITSIQQSVGHGSVGKLAFIEHISVHDAGFWHLTGVPSDTSVATLVLVSPMTTAALADLRQCCKSIWRMLDGSFSSQCVLYGGGCTEWHLLQYIARMASKPSADDLADLKSTPGQYKRCLETFLQCLLHLISVQTPAQCSLAHWPNDASHVFRLRHDDVMAERDDVARNHWTRVRCNCGAVARTLTDLLVVDCVSDVWTSASHIAASNGKVDDTRYRDLLVTQPNGVAGSSPPAQTHPGVVNASGGASSIGEGTAPFPTPFEQVLPMRPTCAEWDYFSGKVAMLRSSIDIAAATVRIGTIVQEL